MPQLYDNSSDEEEEVQLEQSFKVNKGFADKYETKKRTEELSKRTFLPLPCSLICSPSMC
jgi:hypothetical protein